MPANQIQRIKWSDWTECSASCVKTRHRLNCDDILQQASNATATSYSSSSSKNDNGNQNKNQGASFIGKRDDDDDDNNNSSDGGGAAAAVQANDEDDYADDVVEDEEDSCANVDTSKTFEEKRCVGGACRLATNLETQPPPPHMIRHPTNQLRRTKFRQPQESGRGE